MSISHHASDHRFVLPAPRRRPARLFPVISVIALMVEALQEAAEMRRAAHRRFPFDNE
jgi:hypothetical protein